MATKNDSKVISNLVSYTAELCTHNNRRGTKTLVKNITEAGNTLVARGLLTQEDWNVLLPNILA